MLKLIFALILYGFQLCFAVNTPISYASQLCQNNSEYFCLTVKKGDTWESIWSNPDERDLVKRINRTNLKLKADMVLAVPYDIQNKTIWDVSPFNLHIKPIGKKLIIVDQRKLAWGGYNSNGELEWWGPVSTGREICEDKKYKCRTITGKYYVFDKKDTECKSKVFPIGVGGASMPYCMFFYKGFALHGSDTLPGYRDSHGCVRLFTEDAKWLNENFIELPMKENHFLGTEVIIREVA